jgi:hypothetical protein
MATIREVLYQNTKKVSSRNIANPSWNAKKTKPLVHAGYRVSDYVLGVPQI